jgi:branched-chain amino acid transport system ATP-binding protein
MLDPMLSPMLSIEGASAGYGRVRILDNLSLQLREGEVLAVIGPNGAGKSTLMKLICGAVALWSGRVHFDGGDISGLSVEERGEAGLILCPEGRRIFTSLSVEENLVLGATPLRRRLGRDFQPAVKDGLARSYAMFPILTERRLNSGGALSGGQQQMLAIARALMARPRLLLLDEPSLGLSPLLCGELFRALEHVKGTGVSILLVEQNARRSLAIADRGYLLENGRIAGEGPARQLLEDPAVQSAYLGMSRAAA